MKYTKFVLPILFLLNGCDKIGGSKHSFAFKPKIAVANLTYSWHTANVDSELDALAKAADDAGIDRNLVGVTIESNGWDNLSPSTWKADLAKRYKTIPDLIEKVGSRGMWIWIQLYNSNQSGKSYHWASNAGQAFYNDANAHIISEASKLLDELKKRDLIKYTIIGMMSEDDNSTPAFIRNNMRNLGVQKVPHDHLMSSASSPAKWRDHHAGSLAGTRRAAANDIVASDNWGIIYDLFSKDKEDWPTRPKVNEGKAFIQKVGKDGIVAFYNVDKKASLKDHSNEWKEILKFYKEFIR